MLTLIIGDKNLSSWSLRPWLLLRHLGLDFTEVKLTLDTPGFKTSIDRYTPAGRVPVLIDGNLSVWDSLAIAEYLNEKCQGKGWPADAVQRAHARSISAEMHSGFSGLRGCWPMKAAERHEHVKLSPAAAADVARIDQIWQECRTSNGSGSGPWLFGEYSIADAMYAPVVLRFNTYGARLSPAADAYMKHALNDAHLRAWLGDAEKEIAT
jgi:glutathione S-transferase